MFRAQIKEEIRKIVGNDLAFSVERPENQEHGDYSSNVALVSAKKEDKNPKEAAENIKTKLLGGPTPKWVEKIEIAGPGFLNFWISKRALFDAFSLTWKPGFQVGKKQKINLEFVSANPTGPLTMANGRGGFYGDALANILEAVGHEVTREYYVNDVGHQIKSLGLSIATVRLGGTLKEGHYQGEYIYELAKNKRLAKFKEADYLAKAAAEILLEEIKKSLESAGIKHNKFFYEDKNLRKNKKFEETLNQLREKNLVSEKDGAVWFDDRVLIKTSGEPTYLLVDIAYAKNKIIDRGFDLSIVVLGADHHAEALEVKRGVAALGISEDKLKIILIQLVRLIQNGKEIRMGKRTGVFVTMDELLKMLGKNGADAARWFFLERSPNTHMDFDLDLAKERSKKNPVYYVQYAHARASSVLRKGGLGEKANLNLLTQPGELALIKKILQLPEIIEDIANDYQVHRLTRYTYELAQTFTNFYEKHLVIDQKNEDLTQARLAVVSAAQKTLKSALGLMGIAAPEKM